MAQVINTNVASLFGQQALNKSNNGLQTAMQRLSSGLRINSAKDDPTGLVTATGYDSQIRGANQAMRNANDGSVEAVFSGPADKVAEMLRLCADGPSDARVTKVTVTQEGGSAPRGFKVIGTHWC